LQIIMIIIVLISMLPCYIVCPSRESVNMTLSAPRYGTPSLIFKLTCDCMWGLVARFLVECIILSCLFDPELESINSFIFSVVK
jgi:hypothetical protein